MFVLLALLALLATAASQECHCSPQERTIRSKVDRAGDVIQIQVTSVPQITPALDGGASPTLSFTARVNKVLKGCFGANSVINVRMIMGSGSTTESRSDTPVACPIRRNGVSTFDPAFDARKSIEDSLSAPKKDKLYIVSGCHHMGQSVFYVDPCGVFDETSPTAAWWAVFRFNNRHCPQNGQVDSCNVTKMGVRNVPRECDPILSPDLRSSVRATRVVAVQACIRVVRSTMSSVSVSRNEMRKSGGVEMRASKRSFDKVFTVCHTIKCQTLLGLDSPQKARDYVRGFQMRRETLNAVFDFMREIPGTFVPTVSRLLHSATTDIHDLQQMYRSDIANNRDLEKAFVAAAYQRIYFMEDFLFLIANHTWRLGIRAGTRDLPAVAAHHSAEYKIGAAQADKLPHPARVTSDGPSNGHLFSTTAGFGMYVTLDAHSAEPHLKKDHDLVTCRAGPTTPVLELAERYVRIALEEARVLAQEFEVKDGIIKRLATQPGIISPNQHNWILDPQTFDEATNGYIVTFSQRGTYVKENGVFSWNTCRPSIVSDIPCDSLEVFVDKILSGASLLPQRLKAVPSFHSQLVSLWDQCMAKDAASRVAFCKGDFLLKVGKNVDLSKAPASATLAKCRPANVKFADFHCNQFSELIRERFYSQNVLLSATVGKPSQRVKEIEDKWDACVEDQRAIYCNSELVDVLTGFNIQIKTRPKYLAKCVAQRS